MVRSRLCLSILTLGGVGLLLLVGGNPSSRADGQKAAPADAKAAPDAETPTIVRQLRAKLASPANLPREIEFNTPLKDALEFLSETHGVPILIDYAAFRAEGMAEPDQAPVGLPKMRGAALRTVLHRLLCRMDPPATFVLRYDHLVILPRRLAAPASWTGEHRQLAPVVDAQFNRRPLDQALRELSEQSGVNVVLDPRTVENGKTPITLTLSQVAVDTAVFVLADMADLKAIALDTVLYVTTKANAEGLQAELDQKARRSAEGPSAK